MEVIPVIDLREGLVVRAKMGRRDLYRPIETPLSISADPLAVAEGLMRVHPFSTLYVADLDAILGTGDNTDAIAALRASFPGVDIWTDNGARSADEARRWFRRDLGTLVVGSETQGDDALMRALAREPKVVLSLDFQGDAFQGPAGLLDPSVWPRRVIVMTLARVGSHSGPDVERLELLRRRDPSREFHAAGGVRNGDDLTRLRAAKAAGVLVATALHDGTITASDIAKAGG